MCKEWADRMHGANYEIYDPWSHLDTIKVTREEEIEFRTQIENKARQMVVRYTNQSIVTRMTKEMKRREELDKVALNYKVEEYCILYKTFVITGSEVLLPQFLIDYPD